jgi:hypothetical protein
LGGSFNIDCRSAIVGSRVYIIIDERNDFRGPLITPLIRNKNGRR